MRPRALVAPSDLPDCCHRLRVTHSIRYQRTETIMARESYSEGKRKSIHEVCFREKNWTPRRRPLPSVEFLYTIGGVSDFASVFMLSLSTNDAQPRCCSRKRDYYLFCGFSTTAGMSRAFTVLLNSATSVSMILLYLLSCISSLPARSRKTS